MVKRMESNSRELPLKLRVSSGRKKSDRLRRQKLKSDLSKALTFLAP